MSRKDRTPTQPTRPVPRTDLDRTIRARKGDEIRILQHLADSARPVLLDELAHLFPDRARAIAGVVAHLEEAGLVDVERRDVGQIVSLSADGRAVLKHL